MIQVNPNLREEEKQKQFEVKESAIAVELTGFSVFYSQDTIGHAAESLKDGKNKIVIEQGPNVEVRAFRKRKRRQGGFVADPSVMARAIQSEGSETPI